MQTAILSSGINGQLMADIKQRYSHQGIKIYTGLNFTQISDHIRTPCTRLLILFSQGDTTNEGLEMVMRLRALPSSLPIILLTHLSSEARAIAALRAGVDEYFKTPVPLQQLCASIDRFLGRSSNGKLKGGDRETLVADRGTNDIIGSSASISSIKEYLSKVADTATTVLITGETGTGKELAAEFIHRHSRRAGYPMITVNCAALPESLAESELFGHERGAFTGAVARQPGKFTQAEGGTIFLDEIGDMNPFIQAKILHAIEQKMVFPLGAAKAFPINVRIIAASNQELENLIVEGGFREDLYYRLNIARVVMPPLRNRKEDIPALTAYGIAHLNKVFDRDVKGLTPLAMDCLMDYDWPGNVRELMNILEATFINLPSRQIDHADLPDQFKRGLQHGKNRSMSERRFIVDALMKTNWNKSRAAQQLNWSRMTLYRKMARHRIVAQRNSAAS